MNTTTEELLTIREAAQRVRVSEATIRRWLDRGLPKLQPLGFHGAIRIDAADLRTFLREGETVADR